MTLVIAATATFRRILDLTLLALILVVVATLVVSRVVPVLTGAPTFVVGGGSMEPTIHLGSVIVDRPVAASDLAVGDMVTIRVGPDKAIFTHRVVALAPRADGLWIQTKGDANRTADPSIIPFSTVIGRVDTVVPWLGYVVQLLSNMAGVAFLVSLGMLTLLGAWLLEIAEDDLREGLAGRRAPVRPISADRAPEAGAAG
jgi:signal peptidase I